MGRQM